MDCLSLLQLVLVLRFYLVPLFTTYSSVASFCLICCFYFCASRRLVVFRDLEKCPLITDVLYVPGAHCPLLTRAIYALGASPLWAVCTLLLYGTDSCGHSGRWGWPPVWVLAKPCLGQRLLVADWHVWVMGKLAVEPRCPGTSAGSLVGFFSGPWSVLKFASTL